MAMRRVKAHVVLDLSVADEPVYTISFGHFSPLRRLFWAGVAEDYTIEADRDLRVAEI